MIFDVCQKDLTYIYNNPDLLIKHIWFIKRMAYSTAYDLAKLEIPIYGNKTMHPKVFMKFKEKYKSIYDLWEHIVRSCYDSTYSYYKYFGARNIKMSVSFLDSRKFCIWCLKNGFVKKPFLYYQYLVRKDKTKGYTAKNCYVITEKQRHECKTLPLALKSLELIKAYDEGHDPSVSFFTFITRYYAYDFNIEDSKNEPYTITYGGKHTSDIGSIGFSKQRFYDCVADENCCSQNTFFSRLHFGGLTPNFIIRPYDMLKPDYAINEEHAKQGILSYKQLWDREHPDMRCPSNQRKYGNGNNSVNDCYTNDESDVYNNNPSVNIYDNTDDVYS